jgi:hypothetical protein
MECLLKGAQMTAQIQHKNWTLAKNNKCYLNLHNIWQNKIVKYNKSKQTIGNGFYIQEFYWIHIRRGTLCC